MNKLLKEISKIFKPALQIILVISLILSLAGCTIDVGSSKDSEDSGTISLESNISEDGSYNTFEEVAEYIHKYNKLPSNFITKKEAKTLGWEPGKNLWDFAKGKSIGGDTFGNYEGILPDKKGRIWYECDVEYQGGKRGAKRIVFSNDGLIYGTSDHYKTFTQYY